MVYTLNACAYFDCVAYHFFLHKNNRNKILELRWHTRWKKTPNKFSSRVRKRWTRWACFVSLTWSYSYDIVCFGLFDDFSNMVVELSQNHVETKRRWIYDKGCWSLYWYMEIIKNEVFEKLLDIFQFCNC